MARRSPRWAGTCSRCSSRSGSARCAACGRRSPRSTNRAAWRSPRIRSCPTRCVPRAGPPAPARRPGSARPPRRDRGVQPHDARPAVARTRGAVRRRARRPHGRQQRRHEAAAIGIGWTTFPGRTAADLRTAIETGRTHHHGSFHGTGGQFSTFGRQLRKYSARRARDRGRQGPPGRDRARPGLSGRAPPAAPVRRGVAGRAHGGRRPARTIATDEDRPGLAVRLPAAGRRDPARPVPLREPPAARPRRPHPELVARPPACLRGRHHPDRQGLLAAGQRLRRHDHPVAALRVAGSRRRSSASSSTCSISTNRSCPSCRRSSSARRRA